MMKKVLILFSIFGLISCGEDKPKESDNILLKKQEEIEGKAVKNANQLLEIQQKQMKEINEQ